MSVVFKLCSVKRLVGNTGVELLSCQDSKNQNCFPNATFWTRKAYIWLELTALDLPTPFCAVSTTIWFHFMTRQCSITELKPWGFVPAVRKTGSGLAWIFCFPSLFSSLFLLPWFDVLIVPRFFIYESVEPIFLGEQSRIISFTSNKSFMSCPSVWFLRKSSQHRAKLARQSQYNTAHMFIFLLFI